MSKKSESSQHIYRMHDPNVKTEFGNRVMTELGNIKGLEIEETANYILIPHKPDNSDTTAWTIYRIPEEADIEPVTWNNLESYEDDVKPYNRKILLNKISLLQNMLLNDTEDSKETKKVLLGKHRDLTEHGYKTGLLQKSHSRKVIDEVCKLMDL